MKVSPINTMNISQPSFGLYVSSDIRAKNEALETDRVAAKAAITKLSESCGDIFTISIQDGKYQVEATNMFKDEKDVAKASRMTSFLEGKYIEDVPAADGSTKSLIWAAERIHKVLYPSF